MTCKFNYHSISLRNKTYSKLKEVSKVVSPSEPISQAKTIETLIDRFSNNSNGDCNQRNITNAKDYKEA